MKKRLIAALFMGAFAIGAVPATPSHAADTARSDRDAFFIMRGLVQEGRNVQALDLLDDAAAQILRCAPVPDSDHADGPGPPTPFFAAMVELAARIDGDHVYHDDLPAMQQTYDAWMDGADALEPGTAYRHVVRLADGTLLNRYWDDHATPRDAADVAIAGRADRPVEAIYRDLRAGAAAGWGLSARWLVDGQDLATIRTDAIAPVDLNSLMAHTEQVLARAYRLDNAVARATVLERRAQQRSIAIRRLMWDPQTYAFSDYLWSEQQPTHVISAATVYPLYFRLAAADQAREVAATIRRTLLTQNGLATVIEGFRQPWEQPSGWAPAQLLAVEGLRVYDEEALANEIADRWIRAHTADADSTRGTADGGVLMVLAAEPARSVAATPSR